MLEFNALRLATSLVVGVIILVIATIFGTYINAKIGVIVFCVLTTGVFIQGFPNIPSNPLRKGIPQFFGDYIDTKGGGTSIGPGRVFLPLYGLVFNYVPYDATRRNLEFEIQERTPDNGVVTVTPYFNYRIYQKHPVWFVEAGRIEGVEPKLIERTDTRIREWIRSPLEGPLTWKEALGSNGLAMDVMIEKLFPNFLPKIDPDIIVQIAGAEDFPVALYIKYFTGMPALSGDSEKYPQEVAIKKVLDELKNTNRPLWEQLRTTVRTRTEAVNRVKNGDCEFRIDNLGIEIVSFGIGPIAADGKTAEAADRVAAQEQDNLVNTIKMTNFTQRVEAMTKVNGGYQKAAVESVQIMDGTIRKNVEEKQLAIRQDNLDAVNTIVGNIVGPVLEYMKTNKNSRNPRPRRRSWQQNQQKQTNPRNPSQSS